MPMEQIPKEISFNRIKKVTEPKQIKIEANRPIINKAFLAQLLSWKEKNTIPNKAIKK